MIVLALYGFRSNLPRMMKKTVMPSVLPLAAMIWTVKLPLQSVSAISPTSSHKGGYCSSYSSCDDSGKSGHLSTPGQKQQQNSFHKPNLPTYSTESNNPYTKAELKEQLTTLQYLITQEAGTEKAFTGKYLKYKEAGIYSCIVCGTPLFSSDTKYDCGSGWPSFYAPLCSRSHDGSSTCDSNNSAAEDHIVTVTDTSHGMVREEARCKKCGSHLGHVFDDGPRPTGRRYCINSVALYFVRRQD